MATWEFYDERFYMDAHAVFSVWEGLLLRVELLLTWKKFIPSLVFFVFMQFSFWIIIKLAFHKIFILSTFISLLALSDLCKNSFCQKLEDLLFSFTGFDLKGETIKALQAKEIWSIQVISYIAAKSFRICLLTVNTLAPCRRQYPTVFFIGTLIVGGICIYSGIMVKQFHYMYGLFNIVLIAPGLHYYRMFPRIWVLIKPIFVALEAEFDRGAQLESPAAKDEDERQFWEPLAQATQQLDAGYDGKRKSKLLTGWSPDPKTMEPHTEWSDDSMDGDNSEAQFIRDFVPRRFLVSTKKNERTVNQIANSLLSDNPTQDEIDDWFSEVTSDPLDSRSPRHKTSETGTMDRSFPGAFDSFDDYSHKTTSMEHDELSDSNSNDIDSLPSDLPELKIADSETDYVFIDS